MALLACDQTNDVVPSVVDEMPFPNHRIAIAGMGMPLIDNAWLEDVADACAARGRAEFLLVIAPLRARGATGIPVNPLALL